MVMQSRASVQPLLNDRLKRAREQAGYTQADLAETVGVAPLTISRWEGGSQRPCPRFRRKLCQELGKSASELALHP